MTDSIYSVTADTAEEMRDKVVGFLLHRSTAHREAASRTPRKRIAAEHLARAGALNDAAVFLLDVTINHRPEEDAS